MIPSGAAPIERLTRSGAHGGVLGRGCIPYQLRVGVTGHRELADEHLMAEKVRSVIGDIRQLFPRCDTPVLLTVVSPLAEGADRLVARTILGDDASADLEAVLPLPLADYLTDFPGSRSDFLKLYDRARTHVVLPDPVPWEADRGKARKRAYLQVGMFVVDHCDILIALWDGRSEQGIGGTAAVVRYAEKRRLPMILIDSVSGDVTKRRLFNAQRLKDKPGCDPPPVENDGLHWDALHALDEFNQATIAPATLEQNEAKQRQYFLPPDAGRDVAGVPFPALAEWLLPYFVRADLLAITHQKRHHRLGTPIFLLAAAAVTCAGAQAVFYPEGKRFLFAELACIVALITVVVIGMLSRPSRRWITYRFLAERFRSAFFLAAAGLDDPNPESVEVDDPSAGWVNRAYMQVWKQRPKVEPDRADLSDLRAYLVEAWIGSQRDYHDRNSHRFYRYDEWLKGGILILLGVTLVFPILHLTGVGDGTRWPLWFSFASISLPALGAAATGFGEQREFELLSERYKAMSAGLAEAAERMEGADDVPEAIWSVAVSTETLMRQENRDWFGVMRFRDIRPTV